MDDSQYRNLMDRLERISGYIETLVIEQRERNHALMQKLDAIDAGIMMDKQ